MIKKNEHNSTNAVLTVVGYRIPQTTKSAFERVMNACEEVVTAEYITASAEAELVNSLIAFKRWVENSPEGFLQICSEAGYEPKPKNHYQCADIVRLYVDKATANSNSVGRLGKSDYLTQLSAVVDFAESESFQEKDVTDLLTKQHVSVRDWYRKKEKTSGLGRKPHTSVRTKASPSTPTKSTPSGNVSIETCSTPLLSPTKPIAPIQDITFTSVKFSKHGDQYASCRFHMNASDLEKSAHTREGQAEILRAAASWLEQNETSQPQ